MLHLLCNVIQYIRPPLKAARQIDLMHTYNLLHAPNTNKPAPLKVPVHVIAAYTFENETNALC